MQLPEDKPNNNKQTQIKPSPVQGGEGCEANVTHYYTAGKHGETYKDGTFKVNNYPYNP